MEVPGYSDLEKIGRGNFGMVYKGIAQKDEKWYAIKQLYQSPNGINKIEPLMALQKSGHDHIVMFNPGFDHDRLWLVMDFFPLGNMNDFLLQPQNIIHTRLFMTQIADAVYFLHREGIEHGDLKPDNIMVSGTAQNPIAKVADFGLAKACRHSFFESWRSKWYWSPEVFKRFNSLYTKESDIYSMGAMFAAMVDRTTVR
ncbi:PDIK1L [Branchiostoma lanceolatum]|uniref:PDIK1L protein n=1 Tax=Branchiostoma lanceolatum TaxID=7740 RepID=A0A8J9YRF7_BRALA|nr:PDIK1L [Branchiostoma lanceolatum]